MVLPSERLGPPAASATLTSPTVAIRAVAIVVATALTRFVRLIAVLVAEGVSAGGATHGGVGEDRCAAGGRDRVVAVRQGCPTGIAQEGDKIMHAFVAILHCVGAKDYRCATNTSTPPSPSMENGERPAPTPGGSGSVPA